jgi:uncharacterized membrane protein
LTILNITCRVTPTSAPCGELGRKISSKGAATAEKSSFKKEHRFMTTKNFVCALLLSLALAAVQPAHSQSGRISQTNRRDILGLTGMPGSLRARPSKVTQNAKSISDPVALGLATAKVYKYSTVDFPGAALSGAFDANALTAVGFFVTDPTNTTSKDTAFTFNGGVYRIVAVPGATTSFLAGINTAGQMVGGYIDASGTVHSFLDNAGVITAFDPPGSSGSEAFTISDSGQIVGSYADASGNLHGYVDNAGVFTTIDYPGAVATNATAGNSAGDIVGLWEDASSDVHGFLFSGGTYISLDFPLAINTQPQGINDSREIAGGYVDAANVLHGFIYSDSAYARVDVPGAKSTILIRIKNTGAITGEFTDALDETHGLRGR